MPSHPMQTWTDFFVAQAGASAALAGLLFVAISINLDHILKYPQLPSRALETLVTLLSVLFVATVALAPDQSAEAYGWEIGGIGLFAWLIQTVALLRRRDTLVHQYDVKRRRLWLLARLAFNQLPPLPFAAAGILMVSGSSGGMYWVVPGVVLSFGAGIINAWVLLVEVKR